VSNIREARKALVSRVLPGGGDASSATRRAAFENAGITGPLSKLVDKVAKQAHNVTDDDIAAVRKAGFSEDQIFELVVCAAIGQATRQYETALAALEAATGGIVHASRNSR
jgi:hypothetical protein